NCSSSGAQTHFMPPKLLRRVLASTLTKVNERIVARVLISDSPVRVEVLSPCSSGLHCLRRSPVRAQLQLAVVSKLHMSRRIQFLENLNLVSGNSAAEIQFLEEGDPRWRLRRPWGGERFYLQPVWALAAVDRSNSRVFTPCTLFLSPGLLVLRGIGEGKCVGDVRVRFSIDLDVRIHKVIQSFIVLFGTKFQVPSDCELNPVDVVRAKEVFLL